MAVSKEKSAPQKASPQEPPPKPPQKASPQEGPLRKNPSKKGKDKKKEPQIYDFNFDARSKPITDKFLNLEAKRQKGLFNKKNKFALADIIVLLEKKASIQELTKPLAGCVIFYKKNERDGAEFLEVLGRLLLEAASRERIDASYQKYLLFQAVDAFSMAIQHAEKRVNLSAESLIVSIFKIFSAYNASAFYIEKEIYKNMGDLSKDPNDLDLRDKIIRLCMKGKRYYEALYQIVEYEKIMKAKSRSMYLLKSGEIQFRMATVFQHMIDFYNGVTAGESQKNIVEDMGKLHSFIKRFNMDNSRFKLTPISGAGPLAINKTLASFITVANVYYSGAASNTRFLYRHKAYYCMAHNHVTTDKVKAAISDVIAGLDALSKSNLKAIDKGNERIHLLEFIIKIYNEHSMSRKAVEYQEQLQVLRNNVRQMENKKRAEEAKRKEALGES